MKHLKIFLWDELETVTPTYGGTIAVGLQADAARIVARAAATPSIVLVSKEKLGELAFTRYPGLAKGRGIGSC